MQTVKVGEEQLDITETYRQFTLQPRATNTYEILFEKSDVIIAGDRTFAFSDEALLDPDPIKIDKDYSLAKNDTKYIIADYKIPKVENNWLEAEAEINLSNAYREDNKYGFILAIPGLRADDDENDGLVIDEIKIELVGKSLWEKIGEKF